MQPISILLADDDPLIRQCIRQAIEQDPQLRIMWEADNGLQALLMAKQFGPQVVLLDAQMPRMDGIEATRCLRQRRHDLHILVVSVYEHLRASALAAGADAFLTKDSGCDTMRATIHAMIAAKRHSQEGSKEGSKDNLTENLKKNAQENSKDDLQES